jgi:hypothetical protein
LTRIQSNISGGMKHKLPISQSTVRKVTHAQRAEIERELKKSPDFQLYMLTAARHDRERMERLLEKLPAFRVWRRLSQPQRIADPTQQVRTSYQYQA